MTDCKCVCHMTNDSSWQGCCSRCLYNPKTSPQNLTDRIDELEKRMEELLVTARSHADYISDLYEERIKSERGLDCHISHSENIIEKILDRIESQVDVTYMFFPKVTSTCIEQHIKEKNESKSHKCPVCDGSGSWPHLLSRCL